MDNNHYIWKNNTTMADNRHANSKRITLFNAGSFLENAQTGAQDFMAMSKKSIGSYFSGTLGSSVGNGLSFEEIDVLLPLLIDVPKDDRTFRETVTTFYKNMATNVPFSSGKELEIGLTLDNDKPITWKNDEGKYNLPINLQEYIRYRHAKGHPWVAESKSAALGNMLKQFYIFDETAVNAENAEAGLVRDKAVGTYLSLKADGEKVNAMLTLLGIDIRIYHGVDADDLKLGKLYELANTQSEEFNKVHADKHFDMRFTVQKMINTGVIRKIGAQLVDNETGKVLGYNMEEVIYFMQDNNNSDIVSILKAKMQEAMKKKLTTQKAGIRKPIPTRV